MASGVLLGNYINGFWSSGFLYDVEAYSLPFEEGFEILPLDARVMNEYVSTTVVPRDKAVSSSDAEPLDMARQCCGWCVVFPLVRQGSGRRGAFPLVHQGSGRRGAFPLVRQGGGRCTAFPLVCQGGGRCTAFPLTCLAVRA